LAYEKYDCSICQVDDTTHRNLLAIAAGVNQKHNVDIVVKKVVQSRKSCLLFAYGCLPPGLSYVYEFSFLQKILRLRFSIMMAK